MSVANFLVTGKVENFLVATMDAEISNGRTGGRPAVLVFIENKVDKIGIIDARVTSNVMAERVLKELTGMLDTSYLDLGEGGGRNDGRGGRGGGRNVYVMWEIWMDRENGEGPYDFFTDNEIETILNGYTKKVRDLCSVVRVIRKVKMDGGRIKDTGKKRPVNFYLDYEKYKEKRASSSLAQKQIPSFELERDFLPMNAGTNVDITTMGISCGRFFQFPAWMEDVQLDAFIGEYNRLAGLEIAYAKTNGRRVTKKERLERYAQMNAAWLPIWLDCVRGKRADFKEWTNTFSVSLLRKNTFGSMSMFTWYGSKYTPEPGDGDESMELIVTSPVDGYLVPVDLVLSWTKMRELLKKEFLFTKNDYAGFKIGTFKMESLQRGMSADAKNVYALLLKANGGQGIEHVNLASFLGSAAHTSAALKALAEGATFQHHLQTSITNERLLAEFSNATPLIAREVGALLAKTKVQSGDANEPDLAMHAVEWGVYLLERTFDGGKFFYSRVDALARDYIDGDGCSLWEYKSKWGDDPSIVDDAAVDDVLQAAFYCYCVEKMTGTVEKYFYVRYVKIECTTDKPDISVYTHKYRWKNRGRYIWDFDRLLEKLVE
jgi:hypothetical protein